MKSVNPDPDACDHFDGDILWNSEEYDEFQDVVDEWCQRGGIIWAEQNLTWPHKTHLYTTDDDGIIDDMFAAYDGDLSREGWERWVCSSALSKAGYSTEEINRLMEW